MSMYIYNPQVEQCHVEFNSQEPLSDLATLSHIVNVIWCLTHITLNLVEIWVVYWEKPQNVQCTKHKRFDVIIGVI